MIVSAISGVESLKCREKTSPERQLKCLMHTALRHHGGVYHFTLTYIFSFQVVLDDNMKPRLSCPHGVESLLCRKKTRMRHCLQRPLRHHRCVHNFTITTTDVSMCFTACTLFSMAASDSIHCDGILELQDKSKNAEGAEAPGFYTSPFHRALFEILS